MMGWDWMDGAGGWGMAFALLMWLVPLAIIGLVASHRARSTPRSTSAGLSVLRRSP